MLQPANRLPPELLSYVAQHVPDDLDDDESSIIPLTHVCRYWRGSIISTPKNWTMISSHRMNLAALSLERAKTAPLEICLNMHGIRWDPWFLDLLIPYLQNIETLRVDGLLTVDDLAHRLPLRSTPGLRSLTLSDGGIGEWDRSVDPFESSAHPLRSLALVGVPLYPSFLNLRTLTELAIEDHQCNLHLDTLLDFLEGNRLLTRADIRIRFIEPSLRRSRRRAAIKNQLHHLRIACYDAMDGKALISSIALSKGTELVVDCWSHFGIPTRVDDVLSDTSTTHLSNLQSPTSMKYLVRPAAIRLLGPNGTALFIGDSYSILPFVEFPRLPLTNIRQFHVDTYGWELIQPSPGPRVFHHLSSFPALETFTIGRETDLTRFLSPLLSNPSASPSLKTLGFQDCLLTEVFMEELMFFASDRKNTTSAWLHHVVIANPRGNFPSIASISALEEYVPVVDVRIATELPVDLTMRRFPSDLC